MPIYEYKAFAAGGATTTGIVDADTERDARAKLRKDNLLVTKLTETRGGRKVKRAKGKGKGKGKGTTKPRIEELPEGERIRRYKQWISRGRDAASRGIECSLARRQRGVEARCRIPPVRSYRIRARRPELPS